MSVDFEMKGSTITYAMLLIFTVTAESHENCRDQQAIRDEAQSRIESRRPAPGRLYPQDELSRPCAYKSGQHRLVQSSSRLRLGVAAAALHADRRPRFRHAARPCAAFACSPQLGER